MFEYWPNTHYTATKIHRFCPRHCRNCYNFSAKPAIPSLPAKLCEGTCNSHYFAISADNLVNSCKGPAVPLTLLCTFCKSRCKTCMTCSHLCHFYDRVCKTCMVPIPRTDFSQSPCRFCKPFCSNRKNNAHAHSHPAGFASLFAQKGLSQSNTSELCVAW